MRSMIVPPGGRYDEPLAFRICQIRISESVVAFDLEALSLWSTSVCKIRVGRVPHLYRYYLEGLGPLFLRSDPVLTAWIR